MKDFDGKVAVITGGAGGIGYGLAQYGAEKGLKLVLADVEEKALAGAVAGLDSRGFEVIGVRTDVSKPEDVRALAERTLETYGRVDLLFNNAGVSAGSSLWESSYNDCQWVIGVNLWGVINCVREFVPVMIKRNMPGHIVNTASIAGLCTFHPSSLYQLTKQALVALSEQLYHDLDIRGIGIKVSVLCPGFVKSKIMDAERNRPESLKDAPSPEKLTPEREQMRDMFRQMVENGMDPRTVAEKVFQAIEEEKFYIFTHPEMDYLVKSRVEGLLDERNPCLPPMKEF